VIVPVEEIGLRAFSCCPQLRTPPAAEVGCAIYSQRPRSCSVWSCEWLRQADWPEALRPDRCGIVVDPVPDLVLIGSQETPVVQMWAVPGHEEDFWSTPAAMQLVFSAFEWGCGVIWRIAGGAPGEQLARVLWRGPTGILHCSAPNQANGNPLGSLNARAARAIKLMAER
jgi:hypothetical protein